MLSDLPGRVSALLGPFIGQGSRAFWGGLLASDALAGAFTAYTHGN